jgi:predicted RNase H-like HicB family nuclease
MVRTLEVDGLVWQEGKAFVSYCPELDVSSCGDTVEEARANLRTAVRLFLEEAEKIGTLGTILQEAGFEKTAQGWQAPRLVATELISVPVGE